MPLKPTAIRKRTARSEENHTFELIMQRFDTVDKDNREIKEKVAAHVTNDAVLHEALSKAVEKHKTYWGLLLKITGVVFIAFVTWSLR